MKQSMVTLYVCGWEVPIACLQAKITLQFFEVHDVKKLVPVCSDRSIHLKYIGGGIQGSILTWWWCDYYGTGKCSISRN